MCQWSNFGTMRRMSIQHVNRKGQTFHLHPGKTKSGSTKYFFSLKSEGNLANDIPAGFEIHENPNAQVFLRKIPPKIIRDEELKIVEEAIRKFHDADRCTVDIKKESITVFFADQDIEALNGLTGILPAARIQKSREFWRRFLHYTPMLRFVLCDKSRRLFSPQRYCFRGSIDDWIDIGGPGPLRALAARFVKHLGKESFFELFG